MAAMTVVSVYILIQTTYRHFVAKNIFQVVIERLNLAKDIHKIKGYQKYLLGHSKFKKMAAKSKMAAMTVVSV